MPLTESERTQLSAEIASLRAPMLRKQLWVILWNRMADTSEDDFNRVLPEHLRFMLKLEEDGILVLSGPLFEPDATPSAQALTVVRGASYDEVRSLAESEPFVIRGLRSFRLWSWELNEGRLDVSLRLGTGTYSFE
jgi:uncharacterized protein YciI